jgi:hypothetical protein
MPIVGGRPDAPNKDGGRPSIGRLVIRPHNLEADRRRRAGAIGHRRRLNQAQNNGGRPDIAVPKRNWGPIEHRKSRPGPKKSEADRLPPGRVGSGLRKIRAVQPGCTRIPWCARPGCCAISGLRKIRVAGAERGFVETVDPRTIQKRNRNPLNIQREASAFRNPRTRRYAVGRNGTCKPGSEKTTCL